MTSYGRNPEYDNDWERQFEQDEENYLKELQDAVILNKSHKKKRKVEHNEEDQSLLELN